MHEFRGTTVVVTRRLKPTGLPPFLLVPFGFAVVFLVLLALRQVAATFAIASVWFAIFAAFTLLTYIRTRNAYVLVITGYMGALCVMTSLAPLAFGRPQSAMETVIGLLLALIAVLGIGTVYVTVSRRVKWRGRELLELAAQPVDETGEAGYTSRPRPVGRVDVTAPELAAFTGFCTRHMIALPRVEDDRTVLVLVVEGEAVVPLLRRRTDPADDTWIAIDADGNVSAHLARRDLLRYREDLSFDQLCASLGTVFIEFLTLFLQGKEARIVDSLDAMPVGLFS